MVDISLDGDKRLVLDVTDQSGRRLFGRVPLSGADFQLARDETWWRGVRAGRLDAELVQYDQRVLPGSTDKSGHAAGYSVEIIGNGQSYSKKFSVHSMSEVAQRKVVELVQDNVMKLQDAYNYYLSIIPARHAAADKAGDDMQASDAMQVKVSHEPLVLESAPLAEYLAGSEPLEGVAEPPAEPGEPAMEIFVSPQVWQEGRRLAHRGGKNESAALFSGRLCRDTKSPEAFVVFDACLEAAYAVEKEASVTFTGETWSNVRKLLEQRRRRLGRPNERFLASVHRHPWVPYPDANGNRRCEACATAKFCSRSTARPSAADFQWHQSVFAGQPWGTLLLWGYNAREEAEFRLYGIEDGSFRERRIRLLKRAPGAPAATGD